MSRRTTECLVLLLCGDEVWLRQTPAGRDGIRLEVPEDHAPSEVVARAVLGTEAGIESPPRRIATLHHGDGRTEGVYACAMSGHGKLEGWLPWPKVGGFKLAPYLRWLVPLAMDRKDIYSAIDVELW